MKRLNTRDQRLYVTLRTTASYIHCIDLHVVHSEWDRGEILQLNLIQLKPRKIDTDNWPNWHYDVIVEFPTQIGTFWGKQDFLVPSGLEPTTPCLPRPTISALDRSATSTFNAILQPWCIPVFRGPIVWHMTKNSTLIVDLEILHK